MGMKPLFFESCHFWVFLEKYTKYPVFINFFGTLRNLHDIKEREKGNDDDGTEVQSARPFFISSWRGHLQAMSLMMPRSPSSRHTGFTQNLCLSSHIGLRVGTWYKSYVRDSWRSFEELCKWLILVINKANYLDLDYGLWRGNQQWVVRITEQVYSERQIQYKKNRKTSFSLELLSKFFIFASYFWVF